MTAPVGRVGNAARYPLRDVASKVAWSIGLVGSIVAGLVGWGVVTVAQGDAVTGLLGLIPGAVTAVNTLLAAFGVVRAGEPLVTPVADPRDNDGNPLVRIG